MAKPQPAFDSAPTHEDSAPRKTNAIPRQSLAAAVVERLRDKILHGELREGEQLRQDAIAAEFQISRIPVREALSHLAAEGLITIVANRGAVVSALSPDEILQLFEESLENDADVKSWGQWNWAFHSALYAPANRPVMLSFLKTLNNNCDRYTRLHLVFTRDLHLAGKAHHELLDACRTKNPDLASDALWKHITTAGEYLKEFIQRHREQRS